MALVNQMQTLDGHRARLSECRAETPARMARRTDEQETLEQFVGAVRSMQTDVDRLDYAGKRDALIRFGSRAEVR